MKKLLLLFSLLGIGQVNAQTWVTIPDTNFVTYLQSIIPSAMNGNQMNASSTLVTSTTHTINVFNKNITDLTGVQYFSALTYLRCSANSLTSLPPLSNSIVTLLCDNNALTSLPPFPTALVSFGCRNNRLTSLPSLPNSVQYIDCVFNYLTSLPTLPNSLKNLYCGYNSIHCFPTFPNSVTVVQLDPANPYNCLPNCVLPAMSSYTATPLCTAGNTNGCAVVNAIEQYQSKIQATVYPNPTSDQFFIDANTADKLTVDLYDVNGRHVFNKSVSVKSNINVTDLNEGIYFLTIKTAGLVTTKKLVIVR